MGRNSDRLGFVTVFALGMARLLFSGLDGAVVSPTTRYHGLVGDLEKVDMAAKKITVRAADGTVHAFTTPRRVGGRSSICLSIFDQAQRPHG
jgi:hypothetical protein